MSYDWWMLRLASVNFGLWIAALIADCRVKAGSKIIERDVLILLLNLCIILSNIPSVAKP